jgi:hypothetical protein
MEKLNSRLVISVFTFILGLITTQLMVQRFVGQIARCAGCFASPGGLCVLCGFARNQFLVGDQLISRKVAKSAKSRKETRP